MIKKDFIDQILLKTLDDKRVSRAERSALKAVIKDSKYNVADLAFVRSRALAIAEEAIKKDSPEDILRWLDDINKIIYNQVTSATKQLQAKSSKAFFSPGSECLGEIKRQLNSAKKTVDICVFTITDNRISKAIESAYNRGVKLRVITDDDKAFDLGSDVFDLEGKGISVKKDKTKYHMHHKFAIFDKKILLSGSYNWTRSAEKYNEENILVTHEKEIVQAYLKEFNKLWKKF